MNKLLILFSNKLFFHGIFLIFSLLILLPVILDNHVVHANDLNGTDLQELYFRDAIVHSHTFPQWNPTIQEGLPLIADPMYSAYNPVMSIPLIIMPSYDGAIKLIYVLSLFLACETMYLLAKSFVSSEAIAFFIALTYAVCGYPAARITAGHIESVVPYGILPFVIFSLMQVGRKKNVLWAGIAALSFFYVLSAGSIYFVMYGMLSLSVLACYFFFKEKKVFFYFFVTAVLMGLFSAVKILPIVELQTYLGKSKEPFEGSQTIISMIRYLFIPFDKPFQLTYLSSFISTAWGDLEKTAFIGIFPFIGIVWMIKEYKKINIPSKIFLVLLFCTFFLMLMPALLVNPYHWLITFIPSLQYFRVPSRAYAYFVVIILVIFGLFSEYLLRSKKYRIFVFPMLVLNLFCTIFFFETMLINPSLVAYSVFPANYSLYNDIFSWIEKHNTQNYYVLAENWINEVPEDVIYYHNQRLLNTNYGFVLKNSPALAFAFVKRPSPYDYAANYQDIQPGYFITPHNQINNIPETAKKVYQKDDTSVYELSTGRPFAVLYDGKGSTQAQHVDVGVNTFRIKTNAQSKQILSLAQMNYPGWNVWIDGKNQQLLSHRFLEVQTLEGNHTYVFSYASRTFRIGLLISFISFIIWGMLLLLPLMKKYISHHFSNS